MTLSFSPVLLVLALMAVASVVVFFERFFELRRAQIDFQDFVKGVVNVLERGNEDEALAICEDTGVPVANVVATAIRHGHGSARLLREAVDSQGRAEAGRLDRRLAALAITAQVAPLVGLFGTVLGFIRTLRAANVEAVVTRADLFSPALESLVTAAAGIAVAIAVSVFYGVLRTRLDRLVVDLEAAASQIVGYITTREVAK